MEKVEEKLASLGYSLLQLNNLERSLWLKAKKMCALCILQNSKSYTSKVDMCECCREKNGETNTL